MSERFATEEEHPPNQNATGSTVTRTMTIRNPSTNPQVAPTTTTRSV
jgi:hypothetical protein